MAPAELPPGPRESIPRCHPASWKPNGQQKHHNDASSPSVTAVRSESWAQKVAGSRRISSAIDGGWPFESGVWRDSFRPSGSTFLLPVRLLERLRQRVRRPEFVLLGDLRIDRRRLDVRVAELLLDDFDVATACPVQVGGVGVPAGVGAYRGSSPAVAMRPLTRRQTPLRVRGPRWPVKSGAESDTSSSQSRLHPMNALRCRFSSSAMNTSRVFPPFPFWTIREDCPYPRRQSPTRRAATSDARRPEDRSVSRSAQDRTAVTASVVAACVALASACRRRRVSSAVVR